MNNGSFFQKIGLADMEKVHSSVIGWLFSEECKALSLKQQSDIINELFLDSITTIHQVSTLVETCSIDILLTLKVSDNEFIDIIIENKLKSSQHSNQLEKYKKNFPNCKKYIFLTLINEEAKADGWKNITYDKILEVIEHNFEYNGSEVDSVILKEYLSSLKALVDVKNEFLKCHDKYPNVFTDGWKRKQAKIDNTDLSGGQLYVSKNQLETIFQKLFFKVIADEIIKDIPDTIGKLYCNISETHGNADINFSCENKDTDYCKMRFDAEDGDDFYFDFAFQNGTFKVALSKNYWNPSKKDSIKVLKWDSAFSEAKRHYGYSRINKGQGKPRISITKHFDDWYKQPKEKIIELWKSEFLRSLEVKEYIKEKYQESVSK